MVKKRVQNSKVTSPPLLDWDNADIVYALHKRGVTLASLSRKHGYVSTTLARALCVAYPTGEAIIAAVLGVPPHHIWPSRYHREGTPKSGRGERGLGRGYHPKKSARSVSAVRAGDGRGARAR